MAGSLAALRAVAGIRRLELALDRELHRAAETGTREHGNLLLDKHCDAEVQCWQMADGRPP